MNGIENMRLVQLHAVSGNCIKTSTADVFGSVDLGALAARLLAQHNRSTWPVGLMKILYLISIAY
jgi:hypothetical protein